MLPSSRASLANLGPGSLPSPAASSPSSCLRSLVLRGAELLGRLWPPCPLSGPYLEEGLFSVASLIK